ncbi:hypothetical protein [Rhizobium sp. S163]|uniref:hypothetical protein n=1 Tax=Rhizobium sp. S163 TaxID=3055039 RepID=UPI0025A96921|nr:hypothetical protein [Rhizobium sp. S163]MDM9647729.1 hypothetical protein [Rhizobium sp. S163]
MADNLPLFENSELTRVQTRCEELEKKLRAGGRDAHSRIRMERKLILARAEQIRIELNLGFGRRRS